MVKNNKIVHHVVRIAFLALAIQMYFSMPLWCNINRIFPAIPVVSNWPVIPEFFAWPIFISTIVLCIWVVVLPDLRLPRLILFGWLCLLILFDLNRFQPWLYYYLLLLSASLITSAQVTQQWIIAAVYVWGGINKITPWFAFDQFNWLCSAFSWTAFFGKFPFLGYCIAFGETLLGIGLLWKNSRRIFRYIVLGFHVIIIIWLSPLGLDWNNIVIPWNIAMALHVFFLFRMKGELNLPDTWTARFFVILVWLVPVFTCIGWAPRVLSWCMYTNTQPEVSLFVEDSMICNNLKPIWDKFSYDHNRKMLIDDWALYELNVPSWNGANCWYTAQRFISKCSENPEKTGVIIVKVDRFNSYLMTLDTLSN
jgi:hypothetical protein